MDEVQSKSKGCELPLNRTGRRRYLNEHLAATEEHDGRTFKDSEEDPLQLLLAEHGGNNDGIGVEDRIRYSRQDLQKKTTQQDDLFHFTTFKATDHRSPTISVVGQEFFRTDINSNATK